MKRINIALFIVCLFPLLTSCGKKIDLLLSEGLDCIERFFTFGDNQDDFFLYQKTIYKISNDNCEPFEIGGSSFYDDYIIVAGSLLCSINQSILRFDSSFRLLHKFDIENRNVYQKMSAFDNYVYVPIKDWNHAAFAEIDLLTNKISYVEKKKESSVADGFNNKLKSSEEVLKKSITNINKIEGQNYTFGFVKTKGNMQYKAYSNLIFNEGCRCSLENVVKYNRISCPCEHQIGETGLFCLNTTDKTKMLIRDLRKGAFVFDIDDDLNARYYCNNKIFFNDTIIKELKYNHVHNYKEYIDNPFSNSLNYLINYDDYCNIRAFGYYNNKYAYVIVTDFKERLL